MKSPEKRFQFSCHVRWICRLFALMLVTASPLAMANDSCTQVLNDQVVSVTLTVEHPSVSQNLAIDLKTRELSGSENHTTVKRTLTDAEILPLLKIYRSLCLPEKHHADMAGFPPGGSWGLGVLYADGSKKFLTDSRAYGVPKGSAYFVATTEQLQAVMARWPQPK